MELKELLRNSKILFNKKREGVNEMPEVSPKSLKRLADKLPDSAGVVSGVLYESADYIVELQELLVKMTDKIEQLQKENYELKAFSEVDRVTIYDNGISEIHYKDGQDMLVNHVIYSDAFLTGWEEKDCFIKR